MSNLPGIVLFYPPAGRSGIFGKKAFRMRIRVRKKKEQYARRQKQSTARRAGKDRKSIWARLGYAAGRFCRRAEGSCRDIHRFAGFGYCPWHWRFAARAGCGDIWPRIFGQDDHCFAGYRKRTKSRRFGGVHRCRACVGYHLRTKTWR